MTVDSEFMVVFKSNGLSEGEPDLSEKLLTGFLKMLLESGRVPAKMVFMNRAVFLTTEGSPVAEILKKYEDAGTEILSCTTCLEYYGRKEKLIAGKPTNMRETVNAMLAFPKVLAL